MAGRHYEKRAACHGWSRALYLAVRIRRSATYNRLMKIGQRPVDVQALLIDLMWYDDLTAYLKERMNRAG